MKFIPKFCLAAIGFYVFAGIMQELFHLTFERSCIFGIVSGLLSHVFDSDVHLKRKEDR